MMETRTDAELLDGYASRGDDAAFAGIVTRYGAFVHRTCLRLLRDEHEAEDACQAVFLVLARKARRLHKGDLSAWLYRVGHLVAAETVRKRMRRTQREEEYASDEVPAEASSVAENEGGRQAVLDAVDAELLEIPGRHREAIVLRYLRGHAQESAARIAGCSVGTLSSRASRGIEQLRGRLARRGIAIGATALAAALESEAQAVIPETLLASTMTAVKAYAAGLPGVALGAKTGSATAAVPANVAVLTKGVLDMMFWNSIKMAATVTAAFLVIGGAGVATYVSMAADTGSTPEARPTAARAGGLTVEVRAKSATFAPDEGLRFVVTFSNPSRSDVPLEIMQFLQSETAGTYTSRFRNRATGETWQPWQNPNVPAMGAPARITKESLKAGGKRELTYAPYGWFAQGSDPAHPDRTVQALPAGDYELTLTVRLNGAEISATPAAFSITAARTSDPVTKGERDRVIVAARGALAQKLARQTAAMEDARRSGKGTGGDDTPWPSIKAEMFAASVEQNAKKSIVTFRYELPGTGRVVTWTVGVDEKGADANSGMFGFVIQDKTPPKVTPVPPRPM